MDCGGMPSLRSLKRSSEVLRQNSLYNSWSFCYNIEVLWRVFLFKTQTDAPQRAFGREKIYVIEVSVCVKK